MLINTCYPLSRAEAGECVLGKQFCRPGGGQHSAEQLGKGPDLPLTKSFWVDASRTGGTSCPKDDAADLVGTLHSQAPRGE